MPPSIVSLFMYTVVFYDGHCAFCHFWVQFLIRRDKHDRFRFAALDSAYALAQGIRPSPKPSQETIIVLKKGRLLTRSNAALTLLSDLGGFWRVFRMFLLLPSSLRDSAYDFIAKHRYRWFGRKEECLIPQPEWRHKFVTDDRGPT